MAELLPEATYQGSLQWISPVLRGIAGVFELLTNSRYRLYALNLQSTNANRSNARSLDFDRQGWLCHGAIISSEYYQCRVDLGTLLVLAFSWRSWFDEENRETQLSITQRRI